MKLIGLTGGIGMGKSTSADLLRGLGLPIVDTDVLARLVVEPGQSALDEIRKQFGDSVFDEQGRLRRDELARRVFSNEEARRNLETILHPRIRARWLSETETWRAQGVPLGVVVIPLLFETSAQTHFHATICVACSAASQRKRLEARKWPSDQIEQRIRSQWPIEKKMLAADFIVWTESDLEVHREQLQRILESIRSN